MTRRGIWLAGGLFFIFASYGLVSRGQDPAPPASPEAAAPDQQPAPPAEGEEGARGRRGRGQGRGGPGRGFGGGGRGRGAVADDTTGFTQIFNGESLENWDGDPKFWSVQDGTLVGQSTADNPVQYNTFLIWRGGKTRDFELKAEVRLTGGNSGIQYRSRELPERGPWALGGYQADFDANNVYSGMLYGEQGGNFLAPRGTFMRRTFDGQRQIGTLGSAEELAAAYKPGEFNQFHIIARGNTILQFVNGRLISGLIDDDPTAAGYAAEGVLGLQMHTGAPMKLEAKNIWFKEL